MQLAPSVRRPDRRDFKIWKKDAKRRSGRACGPDRIWIDPGIGFGKTVEHNLEILRSLGNFAHWALPSW